MLPMANGVGLRTRKAQRPARVGARHAHAGVRDAQRGRGAPALVGLPRQDAERLRWSDFRVKDGSAVLCYTPHKTRLSSSGDDIRTVMRYYADPSAVHVENVRVVDLL